MRNPFDFAGTRAVVTGAASGIGKATALLLVEQGASVLAADVSADGLRGAAAAGAETIVCDITLADHRARLLDAAGACHHLVNAAGVIRIGPLGEIDEDAWDAVFAVNAKALFFLCQAFAPRLPAGGSIVNFSSVAPWSRTPEVAVYAASKSAVLAITRAFAAAHGQRGVRVNTVCPGITDTPMQDKALAEIAPLRGTTPEQLGEARLGPVALHRVATAEECAQAVAFLLSPAASYVTGQTLMVDGGLLML